MFVQFAPLASQRCHVYVYEAPGPFHEPRSTLSAWPWVAAWPPPPRTGGEVLTGADEALIAIGAKTVGADVPASLVAVTTTRTVPPTLLALGVYVLDVAPAMSWQLAPLASHCCHW